ncbi:MAG: SprT family zinc-dependent metalloprotease [Hyphomicrobiaceae bacterium]
MRQKPKSKTISTSNTVFDGVDAPVEVRRHPGARRMTLRVSRTKRAVIVTVPMQCDADEAGVFLSRHLDWVRDRLGNVPLPVPFADGMIIPVRGVLHRVQFTGETQTRHLVEVIANADGSAAAFALLIHGRRPSAHRHLKTWLVDQARADLEGFVAHHCHALNVKAKRIAIRDQTSRWGSCSTTGVLSFSWRLVLAPAPVLDYVAAHEAAHLAEMNHGPRFWTLVRKTMPRMDEAKRWLSRYGTELHRYGAER